MLQIAIVSNLATRAADTMSKITEILSATPLFKGLSTDQLDKISDITIDRYYKRNETIFIEGGKADGFYIVAKGKIKVFKTSMEGKEQILHIYGPGNPFGEVPVFSGGRFPANAQALSKSHILFLPRNAFVRLISENPSLSMNMLGMLSMRLRHFTIQIENLSLKEVPARLASYLIYLSKEQKNDELVTLSISKGQLASLLGTIPETLSRIFAKMSAQNLIKVEGRDIRLVDGQGLEDLEISGKIND